MSQTAGPWKLRRGKLRPQFPTQIVEIIGADGKPVVNWMGFDGLDRTKKETLANARIMVAAEALLEAAYEALGMISQDECAHGRHFRAGDMLRNAIQQATGEVIPSPL